MREGDDIEITIFVFEREKVKKKIGDKVKLENNEIISTISCRFLVS